jgi:hypothetical protein
VPIYMNKSVSFTVSKEKVRDIPASSLLLTTRHGNTSHDLSLITDNNLPALVSPPGYPVVSEWASYSAALAGSNVGILYL